MVKQLQRHFDVFVNFNGQQLPKVAFRLTLTVPVCADIFILTTNTVDDDNLNVVHTLYTQHVVCMVWDMYRFLSAYNENITVLKVSVAF